MTIRRMAAHSPVALGWSRAHLGAGARLPASNPAGMVGGSVVAADLAVVLGTSCCADFLRNGPDMMSLDVVLATSLATLLFVNIGNIAGCYRALLTAPLGAQMARVGQVWAAVLGALVILAYFAKMSDSFSRFWVVGWGCSAGAGLIAVRVWMTARLRRWRLAGKLARTVAVVDLDGRGQDLARRLTLGGAGETLLVGVFSLHPGVARTNGIDELLSLARLFRIDDVIVTASAGADGEIDAMMLKLGTLPTNVRVCPPIPALAVAPRDASLLFGQAMLTVCTRPLGDWSRLAKRAEDLVLTVCLMIVIAPVFALIAMAVKLDSPGPVLFRQKRLGFNNNVITVFKFRTMVHRPEAEHRVVQARRRDPRVTRVGRVLRRTSLDELPQLLNVFRGEMSLVGPRPHALAHNDLYAALIDGYLGRHRVQPGITGWAQVNGLRGETDTLDKMRCRVEHDLAYTDRWSIAFDLKILFLTITSVLFDRNAY